MKTAVVLIAYFSKKVKNYSAFAIAPETKGLMKKGWNAKMNRIYSRNNPIGQITMVRAYRENLSMEEMI